LLDLINLAAKVAMPTTLSDQKRNAFLGAVGIRKDGTIVSAKNGAVFSTETFGDYWAIPSCHAEYRACRKLGKGGIMYVARITKKDGSLAMSRPCHICRTVLRAAHVKKVFYSINPNQYGIWYPSIDRDIIFNR